MRCKRQRDKMNHVTDIDVSPSSVVDKIVTAPKFEAATNAHRAIFFWIALPILIADQLTKAWVVANIALNQQFVPIPALYPYLKFTHVGNTGAIFGTLQNARLWLTILAIVVSIGLIVYNLTLPMASRKLRVALGLVFGGAIGNLLDRIRFGHVTDFVDMDFSSIIPLRIADWYIWNIADLAIVCAIILMAYLTFFEPEQIEMPKTVELTADDIAGGGALEMLGKDEAAPIDPSKLKHTDEFQSAAEVASIKPEGAYDEALDMLDLTKTADSATELVDLTDLEDSGDAQNG